MTREESTQQLKSQLEQFKTLTQQMDDDAYHALFKVTPPLHDFLNEFDQVPKWFASFRWNRNRMIEFFQSFIDFVEKYK